MIKNELKELFDIKKKELNLEHMDIVAVKLDGFSHMLVMIDSRISEPKQEQAIVISYSAYQNMDNYYPKDYKNYVILAREVLKSYIHLEYQGNPFIHYYIDLEA